VKKKISKKTILVLIIYFIALIIFNIHIEQYQSYFKEFPDELSHVGYIAYLEQTGKIIPKYEEMKETEEYKVHLKKYRNEILEKGNETSEIPDIVNTKFMEETTNHLGHPPLYYHIMKLFKAVEVKDGNITYNIKTLRNISQIISNIALIITFVYAYKNLKTITANFIFAITLVNIPLLPYISGAVSNDVLSFLGLSLFLFGATNIISKKRNYMSYFLLAIGTFICMLNKVTAGVIVIFALIIMFIYLLIKERNLKFIICKQFLVTIPLYICIFIYYILIIQRYGVIQPAIQMLSPEYYKTTSFYNSTIYKPAYTLKLYSKIYWKEFVNYWAGYNYGEGFPKHELMESMISLVVFTFPIIYLIYQKIKKKKIDIVNVSICISVYIAIIIQFIRQFIEFKTLSGYLGGYHSRYYVCCMPSFIILISKLLDKEHTNKKVKIVSIILTIIYSVLMQLMLFIK